MNETRTLFEALLRADDEETVAAVLVANDAGKMEISWHPLGGSENNFGVIENQQASPIAALIEKVTNAIDAILMKECLRRHINPKSVVAPPTMADAVALFFETEHRRWHLGPARKTQAESIQIIASGSAKRPSLLIYDDGEGQHPADFEKTFLSILRGNKNEIPFVQGKYNMGGTGAIVFCGRHRYQLVSSKRFDNSGEFGFTLVRKHPLSSLEAVGRKNTWYEYLKIGNDIPHFSISEIDLGLHNRQFKTGTAIKLYDYDLPPGTRGALPQEPRRAIDQHLFEPALPVYLIDTKTRYPNNKVLEIDCFGLKRRLENENKYLERSFSVGLDEHDIGRLKITCYVFKSKAEGQTVKETRDNIQREFFHDGMAVLFSLNGQVHGHFTGEFITWALKMQLLKHHLLIHVDCTGLNYNFRNELFMGSRDRLKAGDETNILRRRVAAILLKSELVDVFNERKNAITVEGGDAKDLLKAFSKTLPFNKDLMRLLQQTFKIDQPSAEKKEKTIPPKPKVVRVKEPFAPQRYPSFFKLKRGDEESMLTIPLGAERTVQFATDVENGYFDRADDPGELKIALLRRRSTHANGGDQKGKVEIPERIFDIHKASPKEGTIRVGFGATEDLRVGDEIEVQAVLGAPDDLESRFWIKIVEPPQPPSEVARLEKEEEPPMGLPNYVLVYHERAADQPNAKTWEDVGQASIAMDWEVVMHPGIQQDRLEVVYINMDSTILRNYKSRLGNLGPEQAELADKRYISAVYFHTIFLYTITKSRQYEMKKAGQEADLEDYLRDIFSSSYSDFLLNFGLDQLIQSLGD